MQSISPSGSSSSSGGTPPEQRPRKPRKQRRRQPQHPPFLYDRLLAAARDNPGKWFTYAEDHIAQTGHLYPAMSRTGIRVATRHYGAGKIMVQAVSHEIILDAEESLTPVEVPEELIEAEHQQVLDANAEAVVAAVMNSGQVVVLPRPHRQFAGAVRRKAEEAGVDIFLFKDKLRWYAVRRDIIASVLGLNADEAAELLSEEE